jgi:hypothetical protein
MAQRLTVIPADIVTNGMPLVPTVGFVPGLFKDLAATGRNSVWLSAAEAIDGFGGVALAISAAAAPDANDGDPHEPVALMQATPFTTTPASMDAPRPYPVRERTPVHVLQARIRRWQPDLAVDTDTYRAAVLLLAGLEYGQNLDLLARRTSFTRAFVAKAARRLIDNGVWQGGRTVVEWDLGEQASSAFWNDVGVAEGKLCRRMNEDGTIEWAPPGFWNKSYQYDDDDADARLDTVYHDAGRRTAETIPLADERVGSNQPGAAAGEAVPATAPVSSTTPPASTQPPAPATRPAPPQDSAEPTSDAQPPSLMEIFSDAVWIR